MYLPSFFFKKKLNYLVVLYTAGAVTLSTTRHTTHPACPTTTWLTSLTGRGPRLSASRPGLCSLFLACMDGVGASWISSTCIRFTYFSHDQQMKIPAYQLLGHAHACIAFPWLFQVSHLSRFIFLCIFLNSILNVQVHVGNMPWFRLEAS